MVINAECHSWLVRDLLPEMMKLNQGHIVSIASIAGVAGLPYGTDYCASKFAAYGFNESLRNEMKHSHQYYFLTKVYLEHFDRLSNLVKSFIFSKIS